jgi:hypothetical protein
MTRPDAVSVVCVRLDAIPVEPDAHVFGDFSDLRRMLGRRAAR